MDYTVASLYYCPFQFGSCYFQSDGGSSSRIENMCHYMDIIKCFKMGALVENKGVVIKLLRLVVLKIWLEKLATMHIFSSL